EFSDPKLFAALLGVPQVILGLLIEPALRRCAKRNGKADRHLGTDPRATIQNGGKGLAADAQRLGRLRDSHTERLQANSLDDFPGVAWIMHAHRDNLSSDSPRNPRHPHPFPQT